MTGSRSSRATIRVALDGTCYQNPTRLNPRKVKPVGSVRFGMNGWAVSADYQNRGPWTEVVLPGGPPTRRASDPRLHCPLEGYAAGQLNSKRRTAPLEEILAPALHELLAYGGYTSGGEIRERVATLFTAAGRPQVEAGGSDDKPELESAD